MKTKHLISAAVACLLLTGCAANDKGHSPKVQYSDMFVNKDAANASPKLTDINGKAAAPNSDDDTDNGEVTAPSVSDTSNENAAADESDPSVIVAPLAEDDNETDNGSSAPNEDTSSAETTPDTSTDTPSKKINNPRPASVIFTDAQAVANLQLGDICYFAYKTGDENVTEDESSSDAEDDSENGDKPEERPRSKPKYDHGYRVVFRTETDTYLLGILPYGQCKWDDVNDMCRKIGDLIEADCRMVGIPSLDDLQYLTDCGIYLPGQYEMWTSTPASPKKVYYRNKKGAFYSTKGKLETCGVCAIIKISSPQSDPELLSSSLSNYEEAKARLEAEEEQYNLAISGAQEDAGEQGQEQGQEQEQGQDQE